jgi:hypothetical protein
VISHGALKQEAGRNNKTLAEQQVTLSCAEKDTVRVKFFDSGRGRQAHGGDVAPEEIFIEYMGLSVLCTPATSASPDLPL